MKSVDKYIGEILKNVEKLKKRDSKCNIAFRGESKDHGKTKLMPSIFRNSSYVEKEKKLFQLLKDYGVTEENASHTNVLIEAQHYVEISRALDITFSVISALFFACSSERNKEKDGRIFVFGFPEYVSPHSKFIDDYYEKGTGSYIHNFKVVSHAQENERIINQKGGFIFFQGTSFVPLNPVYYKEVVIEACDKEKIMRELDILFGVNEATIYPDRDKVAKKIVKPKFEEISLIEDELSIENEIRNAFSRIKYEAVIERYEKIYDTTLFLRKLRKEKADLIAYVSELKENEERKERLIEIINSEYFILGGR